MFLLHVTYRTKTGQRDRFLSEIKSLGIPEAFRSEKGCLAYDYYYPEHGGDEIFLNEIWEDEDSLTAHTQTELFAKLQELKNRYVSAVRIDKYNAQRL